jgi:hypothetical protein
MTLLPVEYLQGCPHHKPRQPSLFYRTASVTPLLNNAKSRNITLKFSGSESITVRARKMKKLYGKLRNNPC